MLIESLHELAAFAEVADARSFTRAAVKLGVSASALSHAMKMLESRLGLRLLTPTTRSVAVTDAGEQLLHTLRPALDDIETELGRLAHLRDKPAGTVRITTPRHAAMTVLMPMLPEFLAAHPDVKIEITVDEGLADIVAGRFDAGIRFGEKIAKDMIALRIGPDLRPIVVASPAYFDAHPPPKSPRDLAAHRCINYRFQTSGSFYQWEFERAGKSFQVKVDGSVVFNDGDLIVTAALAGQGLAYLYEDIVAEHLASGKLVAVLAKWCAPIAGYHLYYTSRRQKPPAIAALIEALRALAPASERPRRKPSRRPALHHGISTPSQA